MKRRIWDSKSKARIVLEGLQGRSVASLCSEYQITQSMYYRWRDTFLANAAQAAQMNLRIIMTNQATLNTRNNHIYLPSVCSARGRLRRPLRPNMQHEGVRWHCAARRKMSSCSLKKDKSRPVLREAECVPCGHGGFSFL